MSRSNGQNGTGNAACPGANINGNSACTQEASLQAGTGSSPEGNSLNAIIGQIVQKG